VLRQRSIGQNSANRFAQQPVVRQLLVRAPSNGPQFRCASQAERCLTSVPGRSLTAKTIVAGIATPLILVVPTAVFGPTAIEGTAKAVAVTAFFIACCLNVCLIRRWGAPQCLMAVVAAYPLVTLGYWLTVGSSIHFGDTPYLQHLAEDAAVCWNSGSALSSCLQQLDCDARYWAGTLYHGLRISLYGREPLVTVCWGGTMLLSTAVMALPGLSLSGLTRVQALGVFAIILVWPDFLNMTTNVGRDILILWGILAWYSGVRYTVRMSAPEGVIPAFLGVVFLACCRPVYLIICALDLGILISAGPAINRRRSTVIRVAFLCIGATAMYFLATRTHGLWLHVILETGSSQIRNNSHVFTGTNGNLVGRLASLTGAGFVISLPIRLVMAVMAPFPWTSRLLFNAEVGGFNASVTVLACHIFKSVMALTSMLLAGKAIVTGIRASGLRSLVENNSAPLFITLALVASLADVGFNRYIAMSFPFLAATILAAQPLPYNHRALCKGTLNATAVVVAGTAIVLALYLVKS
jgi:hypothetical protein